MSDEDDADPSAGDPGREALAAAKAAAMEKVRDAAALRRQQESGGAAKRRGENARAKRSSGGDRTDWDVPRTFGDSISELLDTRGWNGELAVARVLAEWPQLVGEDVASKATPVALTDGVLTLQAESTAWATQLRLLAPQLLEAINQRFGEGIVSAIHARGPSGPPKTPGAWKVRGGRGPRDTYG